jgi:hypothetical protein
MPTIFAPVEIPNITVGDGLTVTNQYNSNLYSGGGYVNTGAINTGAGGGIGSYSAPLGGYHISVNPEYNHLFINQLRLEAIMNMRVAGVSEAQIVEMGQMLNCNDLESRKLAINMVYHHSPEYSYILELLMNKDFEGAFRYAKTAVTGRLGRLL